MMNVLIPLLIVFLTQPVGNSQKPLFKDNFNYPDGEIPDLYWVEGSEKVKIENNRLYVDANPDGNGETFAQATVWLNKKFAGDLHVEFDAHIISSSGQANNINFFFLYRDSTGRSVFDSRLERREASYKSYHRLNGYIFTYLPENTPDSARFRFRDNPGFNLIDESFGYECRSGKTYHIEIKKTKNRFQFLVDGKVFLDATDDKFNDLHREGIMGFRTWRTELWFDNLKISRL